MLPALLRTICDHAFMLHKFQAAILAMSLSCLACSFCGGRPLGSLQKCSRCQTALYCGRECQKRHWTAHRSTCMKEEEESFEITAALLGGKQKILKGPTGRTTGACVKDMLAEWVSDDTELELLHQLTLIGDHQTLRDAGVMPGDVVQVLRQIDELPPLVESSDDGNGPQLLVDSSDDGNFTDNYAPLMFSAEQPEDGEVVGAISVGAEQPDDAPRMPTLKNMRKLVGQSPRADLAALEPFESQQRGFSHGHWKKYSEEVA